MRIMAGRRLLPAPMNKDEGVRVRLGSASPPPEPFPVGEEGDEASPLELPDDCRLTKTKKTARNLKGETGQETGHKIQAQASWEGRGLGPRQGQGQGLRDYKGIGMSAAHIKHSVHHDGLQHEVSTGRYDGSAHPTAGGPGCTIGSPSTAAAVPTLGGGS
jgi:hypothetical protein